MPVLIANEADVKFYAAVTGCPLTCAGIKNAPDKGHSPRGFLCRSDRSAIVFLVVGADVGTPFADGSDALGGETPESRAREILEDPHFLSPDKKRTDFHREVLRALDEILGVYEARDHFRRVVYTNLVKCSLAEGRKTAPLETQRTCCTQHLVREIEYFKPQAIIGLGVAKDSSPTTFFQNHPPKRSTGESIDWFPVVHPSYRRRRPAEYEEMRAGQIAAIKRWYQGGVGKCEEIAGARDSQPLKTPNVRAEKQTLPALVRHAPPAPRRPREEVTDTTRVTIAPPFNRESAESCLAAVRAARVKCLSAGQELVRAHYDLRQRNGADPTVAELIAAARCRYTPPRSDEDPFKFWRDYLLTNIFRGIFETQQ